jgi:hypothetical protein
VEKQFKQFDYAFSVSFIEHALSQRGVKEWKE